MFRHHLRLVVFASVIVGLFGVKAWAKERGEDDEDRAPKKRQIKQDDGKHDKCDAQCPAKDAGRHGKAMKEQPHDEGCCPICERMMKMRMMMARHFGKFGRQGPGEEAGPMKQMKQQEREDEHGEKREHREGMHKPRPDGRGVDREIAQMLKAHLARVEKQNEMIAKELRELRKSVAELHEGISGRQHPDGKPRRESRSDKEDKE